MKVCTLSPRLKKIAELVDGSHTVADIGTDHAYLPVSLIACGKAQYAIASDIREGPIERARETVDRYNMRDRVSLRLGAGLKTVTLSDNADTIVIAGMGGLNIAGILKESREVADAAKLIILQPMSMVPELRDYIYSGGFDDIREYLAAEGDKLYNIISMRPGNAKHAPLTPTERLAGRALLDTEPEYFGKYIENLTKMLIRKINGLRRSGTHKTEIKELEAALYELLLLRRD